VQHIGTGTFTFSDGSTYTGAWTSLGPDGVKTKHGEGSYVNGPEKYTGTWKEDCMEGKGVQTFASGATFSGDFVANQYSGEGVYTWADSCRYEGGWKESKMHGFGCYVDAEGVRFQGQFFNGKYNNGRAFVNLR
jgi:hypothetical protein